MDVNKIHEYSTGSNSTIAIIDSGISESIALQEDVEVIDFTNTNPYDDNGHGTMMYSIIKGVNDEYVGVSPDADIISLKVMSEDESIKPPSLIKALKYAMEAEVDVINLSLASYKYNKKIDELLDMAVEKDIIVVASSGDYGDTTPMFPANQDNTISVGALNRQGEDLSLSSGNSSTTINVPGENIYASVSSSLITSSSGTSQSSALISGYIALMKSKCKKITFEEVLDNVSKIKETNDYIRFFKEM